MIAPCSLWWTKTPKTTRTTTGPKRNSGVIVISDDILLLPATKIVFKILINKYHFTLSTQSVVVA